MKLKTLFIILLLATSQVFAGRVDTLAVESKAMGKAIKNLVITPDNYDSQNQAYAVLYLLHGAGGDYLAWSARVPAIIDYADTYNIIIVCPDGGRTSWYFDSPIDTTMQYETFVAVELIKAVDKNYNTLADKSGRAITGLSMGGHGAFYLAFKHQDIWGAAGSMSGGVDIRPFPENWDLAKRLGTYADYPEHWQKNTVTNMAFLLEGTKLKIIFDCGVDDFFYDVNKALHNRLIEKKVAHDYIERPGSHNWNYWSNAIKYQLVFFSDFFQVK